MPTTREQDEAKTREHEKKVESYRKATGRIYSKVSSVTDGAVQLRWMQEVRRRLPPPVFVAEVGW